jgi:signal transduction histidine kinase
LEKLGLVAALESQLKRVADSTDLFISKELDPVDALLIPQAKIQIFRTVQEALNNIVKHAAASAAQVQLKKDEKEILLTIRDNGKGFDTELAVAKMKSLGLKTMNERIQSLGGQFRIEPNEPQGTVIRIRLPQNQI